VPENDVLISRSSSPEELGNSIFRKRGIIVLSVIVSLITVAAAYLYYQNEKRGLWQKASDELLAVSELKSGEISDWYSDELHDIDLLAGNELLRGLVDDWVRSDAEQTRRVLSGQLRALRNEHGYRDLFICEGGGLRFDVDADREVEINAWLRAYLPAALESRIGVCTDIYESPFGDGMFMDFLASLHTTREGKPLILVGRFDPAKSIFPFIEHWPASSASAETYIARHEGASVVIVSNLRDQPDAALRFMYPLTDTAAAVVKAVRGFSGIMRATDYHGTEVIAYATAVSGTPWFMVTKKDLGEVFEGLIFESAMLGTSLVLIVLVLALGISSLFSSRQNRIYRDLWSIEQEFSATWYGITDAIVTTQADGTISHLNPAALRLIGQGEQVVRGKRFSEVFRFFSEQSGEPVEDPIRQVVEGGVQSRLSSGVMLDAGEGRFIPVLGSASILRHKDNSVFGVVVVFRDQTELRTRQRMIEESEQQYRSMFEDHAAVKLLIDPDTGAIVDANHAASEFYGWSRAELRQMKIQQINTLPSENVQQSMTDVLHQKRAHYDFRHRRADGSERDVEVFAGTFNGKAGNLIYSIVHDVTEKKSAERRLRLLGRSIEQSPVSVIITNPEGEIEYVNPQFSKVSGYAAEEVLGRNPRFLKSGLHTHDFYADLWSTILSGSEWTGEMRNKKKNGEYYWEQAVISPVMDTQSVITHFIGIKTDLTPEKELMAELVMAKEKAEESDRLKSAFLANMSHEIRTPMNTIIGFSELLSDPQISPDDRADFTSVIRQRSYDLLNIINDILDISLIEAGEVRIVEEESSIADILQDLLVTFNHYAKNRSDGNVQLICVNELDEAADRVLVDGARLRQVLTNLLSNAFKFTQEGTITLGCRGAGDENILFYVSDSGIGLSDEAIRYIFDRFRQVDESSSRRYGGTGLGLAISQGIVRLLGGDIWVESEAGKGSTFQFTIPAKRGV